MKKLSALFLFVILGMMTTFLGCADLKTIDFGGEIQLAPHATTNGTGMIELGETTLSSHWQLNHDRYFRPSGLGDYLSSLIWERSYLSHDAFSFAKEIQLGGAPYTITTTVDRHGKIFLEAAGKDAGYQVLNNLNWNESGDPWWKSFDYADDKWDSSSLWHEAVLTDSFVSPGLSREFHMKAQYRFEVDCSKVFYNNADGYKEIDPSRSYLDLSLKASTYIGYYQYLAGEKIFVDHKGRKATLSVTLIDRDLDGLFTEKDGVDLTISNSFYHRDNIPFGKPIKVDSQSTISYLLNLIPKSDGSYAIIIKQAQ